LVVEDNPDHALLVRIAVEWAAPNLNVRIVSDGLEAISYLEGKGPHADRTASPFPDLVMLDLVDEARARRLGASDFHTKPSDLASLGDQVRALVARWVD